MVFVPREPFTSAMFGLAGGAPRAVPSDFAVAVASRLLPAEIVQKLVLLLIFMLACSGAAALLDREAVLARLAAAVFYGWNPYVAERLVIGQWALLLGYAGLPWVLRAVLRLDASMDASKNGGKHDSGARRRGWPWHCCPPSSAASPPWPSPRSWSYAWPYSPGGPGPLR